MARFLVFTPSPGKSYYIELDKDGKIFKHKKLSSFNQQELLDKHKNLTER